MNKEKNYQKSDHNKKQKLKIIYRFDQITDKLHITDKIEDCFMVEQVYGRFFFVFFLNKTYIYIFLPLTKNYLMFIDNFQKEITYWTLMQYMDRSARPNGRTVLFLAQVCRKYEFKCARSDNPRDHGTCNPSQ